MTHLSEKRYEQKGASVGVDHGVHTVELSRELVGGLLLIFCWRRTGEGLDGPDGLDQSRAGDGRVIWAIPGCGNTSV